MKVVKWILISVITLVVVCIGAVLFLLNPAVQKFRPAISQKLSDALKAPVEIGSISASVFPATELELKDVAIAGENGVKVGSFFVSMNLSDMLSGKIALEDVRLARLRLTLVHSKDGVTHIGSLHFGGERKSSAEEAKPKEPAPKHEGGESAVALKIKSLVVENSEITYRDDASAKPLEIAVKDLHVTLDGFQTEAKTPIVVEGTLFGRSAKNLRVEGSFVPQSFVDGHPSADFKVAVKDLDLPALGALAEPFIEKSGRIDLGGSGTVAFSGHLQEKNLTGVADAGLTEAKIEFTPAGGTKLVDKAAAVPLSLSAKLAIENSVVRLEALDAKLGANVISASTEGRAGGTGPIHLVLKDLQLGELSKFVVLPVQLSGKIDGPLGIDLSLKPYPGFQGDLVLAAVGVSKPDAQLTIENIGGKLHLAPNQYSAEELGLTFKGERIVLNGNLAAIEGQKIVTAPSSIAALGGTIHLQNEILLDGAKPLRGTIQAIGLDLKRLTALAGNTSSIDLKGTLKSFSSTYEGSASDLKKTLNAAFDVAAVNGEILGVNVFGKIFEKMGAIPGLGQSVAAMIPDEQKPILAEADKTKFDTLTVSGALSGGTLATLKEADLRNSAFILAGSGTLSTAGRLDLRTQLKLTPAVTTNMVARNEKLRLLLDRDNNLTFPVVITKSDGPLLVLPDVSELGKNAAKGAAKDAAAKALDKVAPGLGNGAKSLLNKLF